MRVYTIGFTRKSAERFFSLLQASGVQRVVDVRLRPGGQLAGFAKQEDLAYFLDRLIGCEYHHCPALAPSQEILAEYRESRDWERYAQRFADLLDERGVPDSLDRAFFEAKACCLLCSEATPLKCHRRLAAERLARDWPGVEVVHIV